jgi:hypothetical protein
MKMKKAQGARRRAQGKNEDEEGARRKAQGARQENRNLTRP